MCTRRLFLALVLSGLAFPGAPLAGEEPFKVIVHANNPVTSLPRAKVAAYFLKKETRWVDGTKILPVDREPRAAIRGAFSSRVLGKEVAAVQSFWQRQLFSGRETPPPELESNDEVVRYVAKNPGAIGYIAADAALSGVKVVRIDG